MKNYIKMMLYTASLLFSSHLVADSAMYSSSKAVFDRKNDLIFLHQHSFGTEEKSYISLINLNQHPTVQFKMNSNLFNNVFIIEDGRYFVALSNVKFRSNPQITLFSSTGKVISELRFNCNELQKHDFCTSSLSNYIWWYDAENPEFSAQVEQKSILIKINEHSFRIDLGR